MSPLALGFSGLETGLLIPLAMGAALLTTVLYVLRVRRRPLMVPFVLLWERHVQDDKASALRSRLRRLLSWLLHLLLAALLLFSLAEPNRLSELEEGRSVVVLLDVSASMGEPLGESSRLVVAQEKIETWLPGLRPEDQMLLVAMGARPRPLGSWTSEARELREALTRASVLDTTADLSQALELAGAALRGRQRPEVIVVSDGALAETTDSLAEGVRLSFVPIGASSSTPTENAASQPASANIGISALSARRYPLDPDRYEVLLEVANTGTEAAEVEVSLREAAGGKPGRQLEVLRLTLAPGERALRSLSDLSQLRQGVVATLRRVDGGDDTLAADDTAWAVLAELSPRRILVVGPQNNFLDAALLLDPSLLVERVAAEAYPPAGDYDLTIFDGVFPARAKTTGSALYLGSPPSAASAHPLERGVDLEMFGFDRWETKSPVFRFIDPYDVQVLAGAALSPAEGDQVLGWSERNAILVVGERDAGRFAALSFDPRQSDFVLRAVWPLFVSNLVRELTARDPGEESLGLRTGRLWRLPVRQGDAATLKGPLGPEAKEERLVVGAGRVGFFGERAGLYTVGTESGRRHFAASFFDEEEARQVPRPDLSLVRADAEGAAEPRHAEKVKGFEPRSRTQPWVWLVILVLAISFFEWWTYHKRWTV